MRYTRPPCEETYCWQDPENRKHYRLDTSVLVKLVDYAEEGNTLRTHGDVPPWIRELIYAKDRQDLERRKRKRQASISESLPPIHIMNVMPAGYNQDSAGCSTVSTPVTQAAGTLKSFSKTSAWLCRCCLMYALISAKSSSIGFMSGE